MASAFCPVPCREFAPAGDLLLWASKEVGKKDAPKKPPTRWVGALRCSKPRAAPNSLRSLRSLRSNKRRESVLEASCARALGFCASRRFLRGSFGTAKQPNSQQPNPKAGWCRLFIHSPFEPAEHRRAARCAAKGRAVRGRLFAYFLVAQKVGRPPGRTPGMGLGVKPQTAEQTQ